MITIKGYKQVEYTDFVSMLSGKKEESKRSDISIANDLGVNSQTTVKNALSPTTQMASNEIVSKMASIVGLDAAIVYVNGERMYFVKQ